jgi:hypothetical protein
MKKTNFLQSLMKLYENLKTGFFYNKSQLVSNSQASFFKNLLLIAEPLSGKDIIYPFLLDLL